MKRNKDLPLTSNGTPGYPSVADLKESKIYTQRSCVKDG